MPLKPEAQKQYELMQLKKLECDNLDILLNEESQKNLSELEEGDILAIPTEIKKNPSGIVCFQLNLNQAFVCANNEIELLKDFPRVVLMTYQSQELPLSS